MDILLYFVGTVFVVLGAFCFVIGIMSALGEGDLIGVLIVMVGVLVMGLGMYCWKVPQDRNDTAHRKTLVAALAAEGWTNPRFYELDSTANEVSFNCGAPSYRVYTVKLVKIEGKYRTVLPRQESVGGGYSLFGRKDLALTCP